MKQLMLICCIVGALQAVCLAGDDPSSAANNPKLPPGFTLRGELKPTPQRATQMSTASSSPVKGRKLPSKNVSVPDKPKSSPLSEAVSQDDNASIVWEKPSIGYAIIEKGKNPEYHVLWVVGLEQWEDSKLTPIREKWTLICDYPHRYIESTNTSCELERMTITHWTGLIRGATIHILKHSSDEGTLQIADVDWRKGRLDFDIIYPDKSKTNVFISMKYHNESIYMNSFKAV